MQFHISCISHSTPDIREPCLYITAKNGQKYVLGRFSEGLQRAFVEQKIRTSRLSGIFLTGNITWTSVSGLPGLLLSFGDRQLNVNEVHVGPGEPYRRAGEMIASWDQFNFHNPLQVQQTSESYSDANLRIDPLTIIDSTSYIVSTQKMRGRFLASKAKELGVTPGKMFGQLANGECVNVGSSVVTPEMVMETPPTPVRVVVLDLPTNEHISKSLTLDLDFRKRKQSDEEYETRAYYLFFGTNVDLNGSETTQLITRLAGQGPKIYISHPLYSTDCISLKSFNEMHELFKQEFPKNFTNFHYLPPPQDLPAHLKNINCHALSMGHALNLDPQETIQSGKQRGVLEVAPELTLPPASTPQDLPETRDPEVITLGTGASAPSKYRNVISTLLRTRQGGVLFDCGEATANTLTRIFGPNKTQVLRELKVVCVSHMHADHHLGLLQVITDWIECQSSDYTGHLPGLDVVAPHALITFAKSWINSPQIKFIDNHSLLETPKMVRDFDIATCFAIHCPYSYNITVSTSDLKASYSGDTRPNPNFAHGIGQNSDLLIHEATHDDSLQAEAIEKRHSTISEALGIAEQMNAQNLVLTHISQRYPRLPTLPSTISSNCCFAFDSMRFHLSTLSEIQPMVARMGELFAQNEEEE